MDFDTAADELYRLRPEDFTATRNDRVRQARSEGQRGLAGRIGKLRRPTASAWVVNLLVRHADAEVTELLDLGRELREAQGERRGEQLRALTERRRQMVSTLASAGRRLAGAAGHEVGESTMREVEGTLEAAVADPEVSATVRAGRLTTALSYSGFGPAGSAGSTDRPPIAPEPKRVDDEQRVGDRACRGGTDQARHDRREERRRAVSDAQNEVRRLEQEHDRAHTNEEEARARKDAAEAGVRKLEADVTRAREAAETAAAELVDSSRRREEVQGDLATARDRAEQAQTRLDELGGQ